MGNQPMAAGLVTGVRDNNEDTLKAFFGEFPADQKDQIRTAIEAVATPRPGELRKDELENVHEAFKAINTKQTGYIDISEFKFAMKVLGIQMSDRDVKAIFDSFDLNKDNLLHLDEYVDFVKYPLRYEAEKLMKESSPVMMPGEAFHEIAARKSVLSGAITAASPEAIDEADPILRAAVKHGQATPDATNMELCWQGENSVHCPPTKDFMSGEDYGMDFPIRVAHRDFQLKFVFSMHFRQGTMASLMFSGGITHKHEQHIGLDGPGSCIYLEGGSFGHLGPSTMYGPAPSAYDTHTLIVTRRDEMLTLSLDGEFPFPDVIMPASIGTVTVRPWKNKMEIYEFELMKADAWVDTVHP